MVQVSLVGYASAGAFLGVAYFDLYYALITVVVLTKMVLLSDKAASKATPAIGPAKAASAPRDAVTQRTT
jgi:hypothetical protein